MNTPRMLAFAAAMLSVAALTSIAADSATPMPPKQFVYVLKLTPRLHDDAAWTKDDEAAVGRHFAHLQSATDAGRVILAGRTLEDGAKTFGFVIFEAADAEEARRFMESDPAIVAGVMVAQLHPYRVALQRQPAQPPGTPAAKAPDA